MTDDLLQLGDLLEKRIARFHRLRSSARWTDERVSRELAKFSNLESRIIDSPAKTAAHLEVKARLILWLNGDVGVNDLPQDGDDDRAMMSILRDILGQSRSDSTVPLRSLQWRE